MSTTETSTQGPDSLRAFPTAPRRGDSARRPDLGDVIARVRRRWRIRRLLVGIAWTLALAAALVTVAALALDFWHFASPLVTSLRLALLLALFGLIYGLCLAPFRRRVSDAQVALYLEEHETGLSGIIIGAVDARDDAGGELSPQLVDRLIARARAACAAVDYGDRVEQRGLQRAGAGLGMVLLALLALTLWTPPFLQRAATALLMPWTGAQQYSPYRIEISPGNIEIARGGDQLISATIDGFDGEGVTLLTSANGGTTWQSLQMAPGRQAGLYETFLFDLAGDIDYYVTGAGRQSPVYRISVADIPAIADIRLRYHYPAYTRLEPEETVGSGDITALRGTRVEVTIVPTIGIPGGALVFADGSEVELAETADGGWRAEIRVEQDDAYSVSLLRGSGVPVDASAEFRITALADSRPSVSILSPGRDLKVSMIEEPLMQISASDDQGIASLELVMSINGAEERVISLLRDTDPGEPQREVAAEHTVYLEQFDLQPGDLISYYVNASERAPGDGPKTATSDIFFYQVRPFDTRYRRAEQGGGGGGGGQQGGQQGEFLSEQQKQFVVATFKMLRDRDNYDEAAYQENLDLLARAEARIRDRVEAIVRRIGSRSMINLDERYKVITEELPQAAERMVEVENQLRQTEVEGALADAQIALKHLQRADAVFKDIDISMASQGGGSGRSSGTEDLANLFQLEMDKLRHQYDTVQHAQQQQSPEAVIDETLEKLRELARRQQKEVERRLRAQNQVDSDEARARQLALAQELEEMARQLERLSRIQPNRQVQQSLDRMRNAAESMRRAANGQGSGEDSTEQARQAVANLQEAQRLLDQSKVAKFNEALERTLRRAERIEKKQDSIRQEVAEIGETWGDELKSQIAQLQERKRQLTSDLDNLENEIGELSREARSEQPEANESLKQAIRTARESRLQDRIRRTRQLLLLNERDKALDNEERVQRGIARMREDIQNALNSVTEPGDRGLERSLEQMRALARELQFLRERTAEAQQGQNGRESAGSRTSADGEGGFPFPQEIAGIAERSGQLRGALLSQGVEPGDIDPVLRKIDALSGSGSNDPDALERQELALRALMELEYKLRTRLERHEYPELLISDSAELPADYREMVSDYFRELSRQ